MSTPKNTPAAFEKVAECLYKLTSTGGYYARLWVRGKEIRRSLKTKDWQLAKRRLADLRRDLAKLDNESANVKLEAYLETFSAGLQFKSKSSQQKLHAIKKRLREEWPGGLDVKLRDVRASDVLQWLQHQRRRYASSSYNEYAMFVRRLFAAAVKDRIIIESPADEVQLAKRETPHRDTPTWEQFKALVADIRSLRADPNASESGDLCEFMGLSGLGNAEAANLKWGDIDLERGRIRVYRQKTDTGFTIPLYPQLRPLLERMHNGNAATDPVFTLSNISRGIAHACKRLGFPRFTQRSLRRCFITRAVELGIDFKTIAGMQGHRDGGVLIAKTYSHLRNEHLDRMAERLAE